MKNILIPIDFKFKSYDAIDYAVSFFKQEKCQFYFLNTYTYDIDGLNSIDLLQAEDDYFVKPKYDSEMSLGIMIRKYTLNSRNKEHYFNAISQQTELIVGIKKAVEEFHIDLVILAGKDLSNDDNQKYSKNSQRIIDNIRECPVMIIPASAHIKKHPEFVLVSNFDVELPTRELENWFELVKIVNGGVKIITLSGKDQLTPVQKINQNKVRVQIEVLSEKPVEVEYIENATELKNFANHHSDYIICLMDRKPDFWRKCGLTHSRITNLGPLKSTPVIALHR